MKVDCVHLFVDDFNPPGGDLLGRVTDAARASGLPIFAAPGCSLPCALPQGDCGAPGGVGLILGGDGTILRGLDLFMELDMPALGVNTGHLGYLASAEIDEVEKVMERLSSGGFRVDMLPVVRAVLPDGTAVSALNDICLNRSLAGGMLHMAISSDEGPIARIAGDGLVISSPIGSTAYALSAGGPIIDPGLPAILVVAICAHQLSLRPIVFSPGTRIIVEVGWLRGDGPVVSADGRPVCVLGQGESVSAGLVEGQCPLIRLERGDGFYARLGRKLGWGARG